MEINIFTGQPGTQGQYHRNFYYRPETETSRAAFVGTPGLLQFCDFDNASTVRGLFFVNDTLYGVCGNTFYSISSDGIPTSIGTVNSSNGKAFIEHNGVGQQIMITDNSAGYICDLSDNSFSQITDSGFPTPGCLAYQDHYFIVAQKDNQYVYLSDLLDGTSWNTLNSAAMEGDPNNIVSIISDHRELWIFGEIATEAWYNSGNDFPFDRIEGVFAEVGLGAKHTLAKMDNTVFFLDDKGLIRRIDEYIPVVVSTREIEKEIASYPFSNAIAFSMIYDGMPFYVITFPPANKTWMYNVATQLWNTWSSYPNEGRHRANCYAYAYGKHIVGDYENGLLYELKSDVYTDNGNTIVGEMVSHPIRSKNRHSIFINSLEVEMGTGIGLDADISPGSNPQAMLQWSDDKEKTWSNEHWRSIGTLGNYRGRVRWSRLGKSRDRIFKLRITDPIERKIYSAYIEAEEGTA